MLLITLAVVTALIASADRIAGIYKDPKLATYLQVFAMAFLTGPFERPLAALLRREMSFDRLAGLNVTAALVNAGATVGLALAGCGYMSFAWAAVITSVTVMLLTIYIQPDFWVFRLQLNHWRRAWHFGGTAALNGLLAQASELVPYIVLSRVFPLDAVGYYSRTLQVSQAPNKLVLSGLASVILPAFAAEVRAGRDVKEAFIVGISHISAAHWPAFLLLALLAHPAVAILAGSQWFSIVPLVQIAALAMLFTFAGMLTYSVLMAIHALRHLVLLNLIVMPVSAAITGLAALFGLKTLMLSLLVTMPFQNFVGLAFLRRTAAFTWDEFLGATRKSAGVTLCATLVPGLQIAAQGFNFEMSIANGIVLGVISIFGWLVGIRLTKHPLGAELTHVVDAFRRRFHKTVPADAAP
jgi:O-antigen/teichoic acid export membrane protein